MTRDPASSTSTARLRASASTDTAVPHRDAGLEPAAPVGLDGSRRRRTRTSRGRARRTPRSRRTSTSGRWLNYLGDDQGDDAVRAAYGPNYDRLVEVKRRYDPENVFHHNHNIAALAEGAACR